MQRNIISYYPPIIKNIKEIQEIAKSEDIEFLKLKQASKDVGNNMFVLTASLSGVIRFENMLNIVPDKNQSLEERRANILARINNKKISLNKLREILLGYAQIAFKIDYYNEDLGIILYEDTNSLQIMSKLADEILPLNIFYYFVFHLSNINAIICTCSNLMLKSEFHIRDNETLVNDGSYKMDGTYYMNGYITDQSHDFYPLQINIMGEVCSKLSNETGFITNTNAVNNIAIGLRNLKIKNELQIRHKEMIVNDGSYKMDGSCYMNGYITDQSHDFYPLQMTVTDEVRIFTGYTGKLKIEKDIVYNDGSYKMDGSIFMGAATIYEI